MKTAGGMGWMRRGMDGWRRREGESDGWMEEERERERDDGWMEERGMDGWREKERVGMEGWMERWDGWMKKESERERQGWRHRDGWRETGMVERDRGSGPVEVLIHFTRPLPVCPTHNSLGTKPLSPPC